MGTAIVRTLLLLWGVPRDSTQTQFTAEESLFPLDGTALRYQVLSTGFWNVEIVSPACVLLGSFRGRGLHVSKQFDGS